MHADRIAGTYLFHDPGGRGDWYLAIALAALLNCEQPEQTDQPDFPVLPCGSCRVCHQIASLNFEGFHFALPISKHKNLDEAAELTAEILARKKAEPFGMLSAATYTSIPIATAREIKKRLSLKASPGIRRIVIFYEMERMLQSSADALLKIIEEPPADTVMVLTTRNPEALLPTIRSRARLVRLDRVPEVAAVHYLKSEYQLADKKAQLLARTSEGSLGRAIEMAGVDDDSSQRAVGFLLFRSLFQDQSPDTLSHMAELLSPRDLGQAEELLELWQSLLRDCTYYATTGDEEALINIDFISELPRLASALKGGEQIADIVSQIKIALADIKGKVHIQGALMALALKIKAELNVTHRSV